MRAANSGLSMEGNQFLRNGAPHRFFSGALHYFRIVPEHWEGRLSACKAMGLNTIDTYVAWNLHEPQKGHFDFEGRLDLGRFIDTAMKVGLDVILRPGPYICAEWDLGGLPSWLLADRRLRLRCSDPLYLGHVAEYFDRLIPLLVSRQASQGGPIVAVQVENEYGSYGNDKDYLLWLEEAVRSRGINALLFTSDGPEDFMLQGGTLPHLLKTINFGTRARERFQVLRQYQPEGPLMCAEFWNGWFDHWGYPQPGHAPEVAVAELEQTLSEGASINIYMVHGGTNFGTMNGANFLEDYRPTTTSYDYGAPIDETGGPSPKYALFRDVLARHGAQIGPIPPTPVLQHFGRAQVAASCPVLENMERLATSVTSVAPRSMEELGMNATWLLYRTHISGPRDEGKLTIDGLADRAYVFFKGEPLGLLHRNEPRGCLSLSVPDGGGRLEILVENQGRVNYGHGLYDRKGITEGVRFNQQYLFHWTIFPLGPSLPETISWQSPKAWPGRPCFHRAEISLSAPGDTRLFLENGQRGVVWINGFCLGRYWEIGPQQTLYLPGPLLREGINTFVILELESGGIPTPVLTNECFTSPKTAAPLG